MSQRVAVMQAGRILQLDAPTAIFARPADVDVARFVGMSNVLDATVDASGRNAASPLGLVPLATRYEPGRQIAIGVRPEHVRLCDVAGAAAVTFAATVRSTAFRGRHVSVVLALEKTGLGETRIDMLLPHGLLTPRSGESIRCSIDAAAIHVMTGD